MKREPPIDKSTPAVTQYGSPFTSWRCRRADVASNAVATSAVIATVNSRVPTSKAEKELMANGYGVGKCGLTGQPAPVEGRTCDAHDVFCAFSTQRLGERGEAIFTYLRYVINMLLIQIRGGLLARLARSGSRSYTACHCPVREMIGAQMRFGRISGLLPDLQQHRESARLVPDLIAVFRTRISSCSRASHPILSCMSIVLSYQACKKIREAGMHGDSSARSRFHPLTAFGPRGPVHSRGILFLSHRPLVHVKLSRSRKAPRHRRQCLSRSCVAKRSIGRQLL